MTNYKKTRRNGRSKRQKGRSLKRNNKKSRKVMRGGLCLLRIKLHRPKRKMRQSKTYLYIL